MKSGMKWLIGIGVVVVILIIWVAGMYNGLVDAEQNVETARSDIETQLQRRSDLVPNLVSTVKGYASQEKDIFTDIANARAKLAGANNLSDQAEADTDLSNALSRLLVVVENYPDLKSNQNFQDLSVQLEGTENRIAIARQDYNDAVMRYNKKRRRFPTSIISNAFGFEEAPLFEASPESQNAPVVDFSS
ncbi:MAG: LemA family protein [Cellulosilyticum sp.]|nr:LemA family protein [Cellulosilyticum sp.]